MNHDRDQQQTFYSMQGFPSQTQIQEPLFDPISFKIWTITVLYG